MANQKPRGTISGEEHTIVARVYDDHTGSTETQPYLCIVHPRDKANHYRITEKGLVLGRGVEADVFVADAKVSRKHCFIQLQNGVVTIEDLGSTNGTLIDGEAVKKTVLLSSSRMKLGSFVLRLEYRAPFELKAENQIIEAARTDELTGLSNRRWFYTEASEWLQKSLKTNEDLCFVMIDIDRFKSVNDRFGHAAGDQVIKHVCKLLLKQKRTADLLARYGGEEFVMLLPRTTANDALIFCDRLCQSVAEKHCEFENQFISTQVSIGVFAQAATQIQSIEQAIGAADSAMYRAKRAGRNRVSL